MTLLKSFKKFLKTPACGCKKKTRKLSKLSRRKYKGGYQTIDGITVSSPHSKSRSKSRSKRKSSKSS